MKNTYARSIVLFFFILAFLCGLGLFVYRFITNGNSWALTPINKHFARINSSHIGKILDKNNVVLAYSENNQRIYHKDENIRKAVLHTVGDNKAQIATAIQTLYLPELCGYSLIFGVHTPDYFKQIKNIQVTLDSELCKTALLALGPHKGAVCVYNYKNGEILCMVSTPTFDPYHPEVVTNDKTGRYEGVYINRVLSSSYAPGSVFKLVTSAAGLSSISNMDNKTYICSQTETINDKKITCMGEHGEINLKNAMMESCNIYFADLAIELGTNTMTQIANSMGFNQTFKFDRIETKKSVYDVQKADNYNLGWSGVGQYNDLLNPMHCTILMGAIANSGKAVIPNIIKNTFTNENINIENHVKPKNVKVLLPETTASALKEMMRYNVTANYGKSLFSGLTICAKTGTAEVGQNKKPHGWMVGFSSDENLPLAFSVIVENSGYGSKTAGPIASKVMSSAAKRMDIAKVS